MNLVIDGNMGLNYLKCVFKLFQKIAQGCWISNDPSWMWCRNLDTLLSDIRWLILHKSSQIQHMSVANSTDVHRIRNDRVLQRVVKKPTLWTSEIRRWYKKSEGTVLFIIAIQHIHTLRRMSLDYVVGFRVQILLCHVYWGLRPNIPFKTSK